MDLDKNEILDEVMLGVMFVLKIFIREDVIEINMYGGIVVINEIF